MKRIIASLILAATLAGAAGLQPDAFTFTWTRQGSTGLADTNTWLSGNTYLLTNCVVKVGTNVQDLTSCGGYVRVGEASTNLVFPIYVQTPATGGLFACYFFIPPRSASQARANIMQTGIQLTVTNATVTVTDREIKQLNYSMPLQ